MILSKKQAATIIEDFIENRGGPWDWDDFLSVQIQDPTLERVRLLCIELPDRFPSKGPEHYCSDEGFEVLRTVVSQLRDSSERDL